MTIIGQQELSIGRLLCSANKGGFIWHQDSPYGTKEPFSSGTRFLGQRKMSCTLGMSYNSEKLQKCSQVLEPEGNSVGDHHEGFNSTLNHKGARFYVFINL